MQNRFSLRNPIKITKRCELEHNSEVHSTKWCEWLNANSSDLTVCLSQILIIKYPGFKSFRTLRPRFYSTTDSLGSGKLIPLAGLFKKLSSIAVKSQPVVVVRSKSIKLSLCSKQ